MLRLLLITLAVGTIRFDAVASQTATVPSAPEQSASEEAEPLEPEDAALETSEGDALSLPPPPEKPDGVLPLKELTRLDFAPRDRPKPLLYGPRLVIVSESGFVEGHNADTGEFAWKLGLPGEQLFNPVVFDSTPLLPDEMPEFTVVLSSPTGHVAILDGPTGEIRREAWLPFELALPPVKGPGDTIFLATPSGDIVSYDVLSERVVFQTATGETPLALVSNESTLVVSGASRTLTAIDLPDGALRWTLTGRAGFHAEAAFDETGERIYIGDDTGELYSVEASSGKIKFRWSTGAAIRSRVLVEPDRIFVATFANWLFAFRPGNGHELWRSNLPGRPATDPRRIGARLLLATFDGMLVEINPNRGQLAKSYQAPGEIVHAPAFFLAEPSEEELLMAGPALADDLDDDEDLEADLDPDIFGPAEMLTFVDADAPSEDPDAADDLDEAEDGDDAAAAAEEILAAPREPLWFERSRVAVALRNGQVLLLQHAVALPTVPTTELDGETSDETTAEPKTEAVRIPKPR